MQKTTKRKKVGFCNAPRALASCSSSFSALPLGLLLRCFLKCPSGSCVIVFCNAPRPFVASFPSPRGIARRNERPRGIADKDDARARGAYRKQKAQDARSKSPRGITEIEAAQQAKARGAWQITKKRKKRSQMYADRKNEKIERPYRDELERLHIQQ